MLKDVGMTMLKAQEQNPVYAGKTSDDGIRNKKQHEGKGKGWACNNHNMQNPSLHIFYGATHVMIVTCPSLAFAFMPFLISHAIITGFVCICCILFLYFLALSS